MSKLPPTLLKVLREWVLYAALPIWLIATFVMMVARVDGESMLPTLHNGDRLLLYKLPRWLHVWGYQTDWPKYNDIVVFKGPIESEESYSSIFHWSGLGWRMRPYLIKRVVGRAGDKIELREGFLYRNDHRVIEHWITGEAGRDEPPFVVPPKAVYVLGDNRRLGESIDSRFFGPVYLSDVAGVILR